MDSSKIVSNMMRHSKEQTRMDVKSSGIQSLILAYPLVALRLVIATQSPACQKHE